MEGASSARCGLNEHPSQKSTIHEEHSKTHSQERQLGFSDLTMAHLPQDFCDFEDWSTKDENAINISDDAVIAIGVVEVKVEQPITSFRHLRSVHPWTGSFNSNQSVNIQVLGPQAIETNLNNAVSFLHRKGFAINNRNNLYTALIPVRNKDLAIVGDRAHHLMVADQWHDGRPSPRSKSCIDGISS